jgi:quinol monooxygenase YgiN
VGTRYVYIWEFTVAPAHAGDFERVYGPDGDWVQLFRRGRGHLRTELLRDLDRPLRYVTVDTWESRAAFDAFRAAFADEFEALDARCAGWTSSETQIGVFEEVG